jgi:hypothetical protein
VKRRELSSETLVRYLQGEMTRSESQETERLIADSQRAQERVAELRGLIDELGRPPAWATSLDLVGDLRDRVARGEARAAAPRRSRRWLVGGAAAGMLVAAAAVVLLLQPAPGDDGFRRKGAAAALDPDRWVGIQVMRAGAPPEPVAPGGYVGSTGLQISYTNLGPQPYAFLMVFAIDADGRVLWFYPAYERAGTDPAAIAIEAGAADRLLPDVVEHDLAPGRLVLCGLFLRHALTVGRVEAAIAGLAPAPGQRLPFPGTGQHCFHLEGQRRLEPQAEVGAP